MVHSVVLGDPRNFSDERARRIVTDLDLDHPVGIVSTLDIATAAIVGAHASAPGH